MLSLLYLFKFLFVVTIWTIFFESCPWFGVLCFGWWWRWEKDEEFAIICNTGSRTKLVSNFLGKKLDYKVVNLMGGMMKLLKEGFKPEFYAGENTNIKK